MSTITIDRSVVEQALKALEKADRISGYRNNMAEVKSLIAALEQSQDHVPDAGKMVPTGWKLVPVEPTASMVLAGEVALKQHDFLRLDASYRSMLAAAPQPPVVKDSLTARQPQVEQEPVAWMNATGGTTFDPYRASCWRDRGPVTPLYTHPQPPRQPLSNEAIDKIIDSNITTRDVHLRDAFYLCMRDVEVAHGIHETGDEDAQVG